MLLELTPTRITLELANQSVAFMAGIAEDVFVQVGMFTFSADFVVVNYDVYPRVLLILGRPFLSMARALVNVYEEELILEDSDSLLEQIDAFLALHSIPPIIENEIFDAKGDILLIEKLLNIDSTKEIRLALDYSIPLEIDE
nr:reverse transcriptase domain-containing protein [Tanacetum cinerariifolium]